MARQLGNIRAIERKYVRDLGSLMRSVHAAYVRELTPVLGEFAREDGRRSDSDAGRRLEKVGLEVQAGLRGKVANIFDRAAKLVSKANEEGLKSLGIPILDKGLQSFLAAKRDENIQLVEKAHRAYAADVRVVISDPNNYGLRVEEIKAKLLERGNVSESRAELIARDQTLKLNGELNQQRQTAAGIDGYEWSTSLDERVRDEHAELEGKTFAWNDAPSVGHPGEDFQCRCVAIPVIPGID